MKIKPSEITKAAFNNADSFPIFGDYGASDLYLDKKASEYATSTSDLGKIYQLPSGFTSGSFEARSLLAGSYNFTLDEIEVFYNKGGYFI